MHQLELNLKRLIYKFNKTLLYVEHSDPGMLPRCIEYLYKRVENFADTTTFTIRATCMEIYNDQAFDLLAAPIKKVKVPSLTVRWSNGIGFFVENLKIVRCDAGKELTTIVEKAIKRRRTGSHLLNKSSNRR